MHRSLPVPVALSVTSTIADPGVVSTITVSAVEIDHKIFFYCENPPSADSRRVGVSYKRKYCTKYWLTH